MRIAFVIVLVLVFVFVKISENRSGRKMLLETWEVGKASRAAAKMSAQHENSQWRRMDRKNFFGGKIVAASKWREAKNVGRV
ncbi:MAG: hypothetical protein AAB316_17425, partial [Bacteroidota bacterium]